MPRLFLELHEISLVAFNNDSSIVLFISVIQFKFNISNKHSVSFLQYCGTIYIDYPPVLSISSPHSLISCQFLHIWLRTWQHANPISNYKLDILQISIVDLNTKCNNLFDYYSFELYKPRNLDITWKLNYEWLILKYWF